MKTTAAVFPMGSKKRKSNNDDKHGHGQEKHYVEGKNFYSEGVLRALGASAHAEVI